MKTTNRKLLIIALALILISGAVFIRPKAPSAASDSYYESLKIASSSLNGNTIWGAGETFDTVVAAGGLDDWAAFYSSANKSDGGLDSSGSLNINGVPYTFNWSGANAYDGTDTIRLYTGHASATMNLETIGAYEQIYVLGTAGGPGEGNYANFSVVLNYTDGTSDATNYKLYDWYDATPVSGVYKYPGIARRLVVKSNSSSRYSSTYNYEGSVSSAPYLQSATINVNPKKLLRSIDFRMTGKNGSSDTSGLFCGIYAVTGMVNVAAPDPVENIYVTGVTESTALINWDAVSGATHYRLDIATDPNFLNILDSYHNLEVDGTELLAEGLSQDTVYYTRVRAENNNGQSISSDAVRFKTLHESDPPEISVEAHPGLIQISDTIKIEAEDETGVSGIEASLDEGETWDQISDSDYVEYEATENATYCFRASDVYENYSDKKCVTYERLDNQKPEISVNFNGYDEGSWTNSVVTLTVEDVSLNLGETKYYYSEDNLNWVEFDKTLIVNEETGLDGKTFYFKAVSEAGVESDVKTALVRRDITAPSGEISSASNNWNSFLNTITFGLFFNETKEFSIESNDNLSGIEKVEYLITDSEVSTEEEANALEGWQDYNDSVSIDPEGDFVLYFRLTDGANNVNIINTDGIVLDSTAALIKGYVENGTLYDLEDGKTYYLTQKIIITDNRALDKIYINGEEVPLSTTNIIELSGNSESVYEITALDKAGNVSSLTVNTGKIEDLELDIDPNTANSDDLNDLRETIEELRGLEATEGANETDEEKEVINNIINEYEELIEKLEEIVEHLDTIEEDVNSVPSIENVTPSDKENIEALLEEIRTTEEENGNNLTVDELNQLIVEEEELEEKLARIEEIEEEEEAERIRQEEEERRRQEEEERARQEAEAQRIKEEHVQEFEDKVNNEYPDADSVEEDDKTVIDEGTDLYNNLTDEEKEMVDPAVKEHYDEIIEIYYHTAPTLEIRADTENWKVSDTAELIASDASGIEGLYVSTDNGENWTKLTSYNSIAYEATANGIYKFKAVDKTGNETTETIIYNNLDPIKPVVELNSNGYELGTWTNKNVTLSAANVANNLSPVEIFVSTDGENWVAYSESIVHTEDTSAEGITYYFKAKSAAGLESDVVKGNVRKDTVAPTGSIELGDNGWNSFLNTITFGLFFNETKEFRLIPDEDVSGIAKAEYLVLEDDFKTPEELKSADGWTESETTLAVSPEKDFVVYFKITDGAGNINIINSEGVVLDITPATIEGLASGRTYPLEEDKVYYLTQKILISDNKGISTITLNDTEVEAVNGVLELPGNVDLKNEIVVVDKAGNITELTVNTRAITSPSDLDLDYANKNDIEKIEAAKETLEEIKSDADASPTVEELEIIDDFISEFNEALETIAEVEAKIEDIENKYALVPEAEVITSNDKENIEALIEEIEDVLNNDKNHLTEEEDVRLEEILEDLNRKHEIIEAVEQKLAELETETESYNIETVNKDDKEDLEGLKEEIEEFENSPNLTAEEREELEEEKAKIDELLARIKEAEQALEDAKENDAAKEINKNNVTKEDQTTLEDAQAGYVEALGVFDGNFSLSELFDINNAISIINSALDVLDQVAEFEAMISKLPNPEDVDYSSRTAIKAAQIAYAELSDYAKTLVGPSLMSKYKAVLSAYKAFLDGSPLLTAFETLDVFWWAISTFFIAGTFIIIAKRTHKRYSDVEESDDF